MASTTSPTRRAPVAEAARYVPCSTKTIRRKIASGDLPAYRFGDKMLLVDLDDVDRLLRRIPSARGGAA